MIETCKYAVNKLPAIVM